MGLSHSRNRSASSRDCTLLRYGLNTSSIDYRLPLWDISGLQRSPAAVGKEATLISLILGGIDGWGGLKMISLTGSESAAVPSVTKNPFLRTLLHNLAFPSLSMHTFPSA